MPYSSDSDDDRPRIRFRGGSSSDSDDGANPGGILAAGVMLGVLAAEQVRNMTTRKVNRRRQRRRAPKLQQKEFSGDLSEIEYLSISETNAPLEPASTDSASFVAGTSDPPPKYREGQDPRKSTNDGWSEVTLDEVISEEAAYWRDETPKAVDAVSSNGSASRPVEHRRAMNTRASSFQKVSSRVYSRVRMESFSAVEMNLSTHTAETRKPHTTETRKHASSNRNGKARPKRSREQAEDIPLSAQCHWAYSSHNCAAAPSPSHIGRLQNRTISQGGLADLRKL